MVKLAKQRAIVRYYPSTKKRSYRRRYSKKKHRISLFLFGKILFGILAYGIYPIKDSSREHPGTGNGESIPIVVLTGGFLGKACRSPHELFWERQDELDRIKNK